VNEPGTHLMFREVLVRSPLPYFTGLSMYCFTSLLDLRDLRENLTFCPSLSCLERRKDVKDEMKEEKAILS